MNNPDELLLELMEEYKPHLQSYRHRMNTWGEVLVAFNNKTGANYKQIRTLKTRFEKLKESYIKGEEMEAMDVDLLKKLIEEDGYPSTNKKSGSTGNPSLTIDPSIVPHKKMKMIAEETSDENGRESSSSQPPPLDSITVFPHTQMKRLQEQQYNSYTGSTPQNNRRPSVGSIGGGSHYSSSAAPTPNSQGVKSDKSFDDPLNSQLLMNLLSIMKSQKHLQHQHQHLHQHQMPSQEPNQITLDTVYRELQQLRKAQEDFQSEVILKLDYLTSLIKKDPTKSQVDAMEAPLDDCVLGSS